MAVAAAKEEAKHQEVHHVAKPVAHRDRAAFEDLPVPRKGTDPLSALPGKVKAPRQKQQAVVPKKQTTVQKKPAAKPVSKKKAPAKTTALESALLQVALEHEVALVHELSEHGPPRREVAPMERGAKAGRSIRELEDFVGGVQPQQRALEDYLTTFQRPAREVEALPLEKKPAGKDSAQRFVQSLFG